MTPLLIASGSLAGLTAASTLASISRFTHYCLAYVPPALGDRPPIAYTITPFKSDGDQTFEDNLVSILEQDYPASYTSVFVTHSEEDPGVPIVRKLMTRYPHARLLIAGHATGCSQMIHNQLAALDAMPADAGAIVVIDSDLRLRRDTLTHMIAPLQDPKVGSTFGYPHYLPPRCNLASLVRSFWNLCGGLFLVDPIAKYPWGGLFALTTDVASKIDLHQLWGPCLTDDFPLRDELRRRGLEQRFVPQGILPAYEGGTPMSLVKWTDKRQTIMRVYHPAMWWQIAVGLVVLRVALIAVLLAAWAGSPAGVVSVAAGWFAAEMLIFAALVLVMRRIMPESKPWTAVQLITLPVCGPLSLLLVAWNTLISACSRKVIWGGKVYELHQPRDVRIVPPKRAAA